MQEQLINKILRIHTTLQNNSMEYWHQYSNLYTWQFWIILAFFALPLIALYIFIDRKRALLLGFFGFNVHIWFTYIDTFGGINNYWFYPHKLLPFYTTSLSLDASLVPVLFILLYQWTLKHNKNYYLYIFILCAFFSFIFKPILVYFDLFQLTNSNYFYLFLGYVVIALVSKIITNLFIWFEKTAKNPN